MSSNRDQPKWDVLKTKDKGGERSRLSGLKMKWDARKRETGRSQWVKILVQVCEEALEPEQTESIFLSLKRKLKDAGSRKAHRSIVQGVFKERWYLEHKHQA